MFTEEFMVIIRDLPSNSRVVVGVTNEQRVRLDSGIKVYSDIPLVTMFSILHLIIWGGDDKRNNIL